MTANEAFKVWFDAMKAQQPRETLKALYAEYMRIDKEEKAYNQPVRIETSYRRNGRAFRVAVYADGTTADLD